MDHYLSGSLESSSSLLYLLLTGGQCTNLAIGKKISNEAGGAMFSVWQEGCEFLSQKIQSGHCFK